MNMRGLISIQLGILLFCCLAPSEADGQIYGDNVVIVLDGSGSMREPMGSSPASKMTAAKSALREILSQLPATTQVGLLVFSNSTPEDWPCPLGPLDAASLKTAIDSIRPGGKTPLGKYIKIGADRLLRQRDKQFGYGTYRLLIVTDGEAQDPALVDRHARDVIARGITVDVIGVAMKRDHTLATKAHSYRRADDAASLKQAIAEVMAEVSATDSGAAAGEDAFEVLEGLPLEVAQAMLGSLASSGNHPIGESPPASVRSRGAAQAPRTSDSPPGTTGAPGTVPPAEPGGMGVGKVMLAVAALALVMLVLVARKLKGGC